MTDAGQIFALLRSASAAELAKRFNVLDESAPLPAPPRSLGADAARPAAPVPSGTSSTGTAFSGGPSSGGTGLPGAGSPPGGGGLGAGLPGSGLAGAGGALATGVALPTGAGAAVEGATATPLPGSTLGAEAADALTLARPAVLRAALSLVSLAPPRADLVRLLNDAASSGLHRMPGAGGASPTPTAEGVRLAGTGLVPGAGGAATLADVDRPGAAAGPLATDSETTTQAFVSQPSARAGAALAAGLGGLSTLAAAQVAAESAEASSPRPGTLQSGQGGAVGGPAPGLAAATAGTAAQAPAGLEGARAADAATPTPQSVATSASGDSLGVAARTATVAQVAFAEAVIALLDAAGSGRGGSVASGVIFNAAMMPGWPFPSAFAKDGPDGINPKALLQRLATAVEGMSPQEAAEYLAQIGGSHVLLRNLRKILMQLDMIDKEDVKGLLFSFLETLGAIASGLEKAFKLMAEGAALQAAVAHGEVPEDGDRPGRRRIRL